MHIHMTGIKIVNVFNGTYMNRQSELEYFSITNLKAEDKQFLKQNIEYPANQRYYSIAQVKHRFFIFAFKTTSKVLRTVSSII